MLFRMIKDRKLGDIRDDMNYIATHINENIKYNIREKRNDFLVELSRYTEGDTGKIDEYLKKRGYQKGEG